MFVGMKIIPRPVHFPKRMGLRENEFSSFAEAEEMVMIVIKEIPPEINYYISWWMVVVLVRQSVSQW